MSTQFVSERLGREDLPNNAEQAPPAGLIYTPGTGETAIGRLGTHLGSESMSHAVVVGLLRQGTTFIRQERATLSKVRCGHRARALHEPLVVLLSEVSGAADAGWAMRHRRDAGRTGLWGEHGCDELVGVRR